MILQVHFEAQHSAFLGHAHLSLSHLQLVPSQPLQVHGQHLLAVHPVHLQEGPHEQSAGERKEQ